MEESTQYLESKHHRCFHSCAAFPRSIPQVVFTGKHDHRQPFAGDIGVGFDLLSVNLRMTAKGRYDL